MSVPNQIDMDILDSLSNSLYMLQDLGLITEQQVAAIYAKLPNMDTIQISYCRGIIDLTYRINQMYKYYNYQFRFFQ
jgi:hypothetical protein